uniref:UBE2O-like tandem tSH3-B domain-containing protein n=1 Tax=Ananas comosus var. bracteatus TaxID=296719 RepID=A0A6V7QMZ7_ANACO|nr:unnamed protein product [Ananas comosus var. bracteatus]
MDYDEDDDVLPDGKAAVRWTDGYETVDDMTDITVVDRNFVLGDVVASASDPTGQLGVVMDVNKIVDLKAANGDIIKGVSSKDLTCIRKFSEDDFVVMGPWLGQVEQVFENVTVAFDDGSACIVYRADNLELLPAQEPPFDETNCPITLDSVFGRLIFKPKNLAVLSCISYADWQLGDWCLLPSPPQTASYGNDASTSVELTESSGVPLNIPEAGQTIKGKKAESSGVVSTDASCVELGSGHIVDGPCRIEKESMARCNEEYQLDSTSLIPIRNPNDHEFFPDDYVVDKSSNDVDNSSEGLRVGHHEVYVVYEEDDEEWSESESFGSDGSASWETAAEDKMEVDDSEKEVDQKTRDLVHGENDGAAEEKDELKTKDSFKHFDIAQNPVDHHFITGNGEGTSGRKWTKKVQQEWNVLEKDLPGLDYAPVAFYHSGGLELNPNLYPDGKGLVLNSKPYFNEPGYEKQIGSSEGEKNSLSFNENTYLMSLRSMLYLLRRPPMHFEDFVKDHFRKRGLYILKACEAYLGGSCIGSLTEEACTTEKSREHSCSTGFKLTLAKIFATTNFSIKRGFVVIDALGSSVFPCNLQQR